MYKNRKSKKKNKNKKNKTKKINLLYANADGIMGKVPSLLSAAKASDAHIIAITETKIGKTPPLTPGYQWYNKNRKTQGGGIAILVRDDIIHLTERIDENILENQEQEILWIRTKNTQQKVNIGVFYGPQEKCSNEEADRQFSQITSQINKLKKTGEVVLVGDFNAKIEIENDVVKQTQSKNGKYMQKMIDETNVIVKSVNATFGHWTRVKRKDVNEKSVIDYVLMSERIASSTQYIEIDESGAYRLKGKAETDHNSILTEIDLNFSKNIKTEVIYNTKNKKRWYAFNKKLTKKYEEKPPENYEEFEALIKNTMKESLEKIKIKKGQYKPKITEKAKKLKEEKREARKSFEKAPPEDKLEKLDQYMKKQIELKWELEIMEKQMVEARINKLIEEGGVRSDSFWKIRKQIIKKATEHDEYDTVTEEGLQLTEPEASKEYIASFFENLYQARECHTGYEQTTKEIIEKVQEIENNMHNIPKEPEFSTEEIYNVLRNLKSGKAPGPDGIPNEAMKYFDRFTIEIYRQEMNKILDSMEIPHQWTEGSLKRLYKGKGLKGKCSNERGITLASNLGKMFERLINSRINDQINMTDAQAGGIKGRATVDHILIMKDLIDIAKKDKKHVILTYLDVTKAYDKAWLDGILYVLHKQGVTSRLWKLVKCLNSNLKTTIQTKHGATRKIEIKDSIRQGGVLSVSLYALLMDEINKDMKQTQLGIEVPGSDTRIPCLLWMDDVLLIETNEQKKQALLNSTDHTSKKYHIEFGMPKTKFLRPNKVKTSIDLKLGEKNIEETDKYTYLGEVNNKGMNLKDQIKNIEGKVEAAYQTLVAVAEDQNFKSIKMECIWKLVKTCIVPIITYASETWEPNKKEMKKLNQILDKIIKRILMTPEATPREALYIETGLLDVETIIDIKRLNMMCRLNNTKSELMATVLANPQSKWMKKTKEIMEKYNIEESDLNGSKEKANEAINLAMHMKIYNRVYESREERSKLKFFLDGKRSWIVELLE